MSVIPLSQAGRGEQMTTSSMQGDAPSHDHYREHLQRDESEKFDRHFEKAFGEAEGRERTKAPPAKKSLDDLIGDVIAKHEGLEADEKAWADSRETRDTLNKRYEEHDATTAKTLNMYIGWAKEFRRDPVAAAQMFAQAYLGQSPYNLPEEKEKVKPDYSDLDWLTRSKAEANDKLNALLDHAVDRATSEKTEFADTAEARAPLKQMYPTLSFDAAIKKIEQIDRDAHRDPVGTAAVLAAAFGAPVTQAQQAHADRQAGIVREIEGMVQRGQLPAAFLQNPEPVWRHLNEPGFVRTGNWQHDLARAAANLQMAPR